MRSCLYMYVLRKTGNICRHDLLELPKNVWKVSEAYGSILYPSCKCQINDLYITCEYAERLLASTTLGISIALYPFTRALFITHNISERNTLLSHFNAVVLKNLCNIVTKSGTPRYEQFTPCHNANIANFMRSKKNLPLSLSSKVGIFQMHGWKGQLYHYTKTKEVL